MKAWILFGALLATIGLAAAHPDQSSTGTQGQVQFMVDELYAVLHRLKKGSGSKSHQDMSIATVTAPSDTKVLFDNHPDGEEHIMKLQRDLRTNSAHRGEDPKVDAIDGALQKCAALKCKVMDYLKGPDLVEDDKQHLNQVQVKTSEAEEFLKKHALFPNGWPPKATTKPSGGELKKLTAKGDRLTKELKKAEGEQKKLPDGSHNREHLLGEAKKKIDEIKQTLVSYEKSSKNLSTQTKVAEMEKIVEGAANKLLQEGHKDAGSQATPHPLQPKASTKGKASNAFPALEAEVERKEQEIAQLDHQIDQNLKEAGKIPEVKRIQDALKDIQKANKVLSEILAGKTKREHHEKMAAYHKALRDSEKFLTDYVKKLKEAESKQSHPTPAQNKALEAKVRKLETERDHKQHELATSKAKIEEEHERLLNNPPDTPEKAIEIIRAAETFVSGLVPAVPKEEKPKVQEAASALNAGVNTLNECRKIASTKNEPLRSEIAKLKAEIIAANGQQAEEFKEEAQLVEKLKRAAEHIEKAIQSEKSHKKPENPHLVNSAKSVAEAKETLKDNLIPASTLPAGHKCARTADELGGDLKAKQKELNEKLKGHGQDRAKARKDVEEHLQTANGELSKAEGTADKASHAEIQAAKANVEAAKAHARKVLAHPSDNKPTKDLKSGKKSKPGKKSKSGKKSKPGKKSKSGEKSKPDNESKLAKQSKPNHDPKPKNGSKPNNGPQSKDSRKTLNAPHEEKLGEKKLKEKHAEEAKKLDRMVEDYRKMRTEFCKANPENATCKAKLQASAVAMAAEKLAKDLKHGPTATPEIEKAAAEVQCIADTLKEADPLSQAETPILAHRYVEDLTKKKEAIKKQQERVKQLADKLGLPPVDQKQRKQLDAVIQGLETHFKKKLDPAVQKDLNELKTAIHPDPGHGKEE